MYRSVFTDDDDISNRNKPNSPARSNASMPLFSDSDNENGSMIMVSKKTFLLMKCVSADSIKNRTKKLQQGWSPSPKKLKLIKTHIEEQDVAIFPSLEPSTSTSHAGINKKILQLENFLLHMTYTIFKNNIMRNLAFLKVKMRQIQSNNTYTNKKSLSQNDFHDCPLPLDNNIDLNTVEDKIAGNHKFKSCLINELLYIGGKKCKSMVKRLMSKLFTDDLLSDYFYTGKKGKKPFLTLFICSVLFVVTGEVSETSLLLFALTAGIQYFSGTIFQGNRLLSSLGQDVKKLMESTPFLVTKIHTASII
ncbi:hypothetical protein QTP88_023526 [Uroleucon formosanum]